MITTDFDASHWQGVISDPHWYLEYFTWKQNLDGDVTLSDEQKQHRIELARAFFMEALETGTVAVADIGPDMDSERQPIDTIVIHHTSNERTYTLSRLNAVQLLNIYVPVYAQPSEPGRKAVTAKPLWSGHFYEDRQVFWGYHWMLRMDGTTERLLPDSALGWHAGNWEVNRRSIAICLDNDYENQDPTTTILDNLAGLIQTEYPTITPKNIIGHNEARSGTDCPGIHFLGGWKQLLLERLV